jgi:glycine cleavage system H protein
MPEFLQFSLDKFTFRVATDRSYSIEGVWAKIEGTRARLGISDYQQQRNGDVAFAEIKPVGTELRVGDEFASIETIKVNFSLTSPLNGRIIEINPAMSDNPEVINQDPYGQGWMAMIELQGEEAGLEHMMEPQAYLDKIKREAEQETSQE